MKDKKIAIVLGTRPEFIKLFSIIKELALAKTDFFVIHTGQHYSYYLDGIFFKEFALRKPKYNLETGSLSANQQIAKVLIGLEEILKKEKPDLVLVQGDTNSAFAGAIASVKLGIPVGHVEAGLRSFNFNMAEEQNRILIDHMSFLLFSPTANSAKNLIKEGISKSKIFITGNTVVDSLKLFSKRIKKNKSDYILVTIHRAESTDSYENLKNIVAALNELAGDLPHRIVFPIHPRTKKFLKLNRLELKSIDIMEPVGYVEFLTLLKNCRAVITDSGGVQEEACVLGVPTITVRDETERPETVKIGANVVTGYDSVRIIKSVKKMLHQRKSWVNPFGNGQAGKKIVKIIKKSL